MLMRSNKKAVINRFFIFPMFKELCKIEDIEFKWRRMYGEN